MLNAMVKNQPTSTLFPYIYERVDLTVATVPFFFCHLELYLYRKLTPSESIEDYMIRHH